MNYCAKLTSKNVCYTAPTIEKARLAFAWLCHEADDEGVMEQYDGQTVLSTVNYDDITDTEWDTVMADMRGEVFIDIQFDDWDVDESEVYSHVMEEDMPHDVAILIAEDVRRQAGEEEEEEEEEENSEWNDIDDFLFEVRREKEWL
jgi:hypothetical protein